MLDLIKYIVEQFAEDKDNVEYEVKEKDRVIEVTVVLTPSDMGKVIGKQGKIAKAMRTIVRAATPANSKKYVVEIREKGISGDIRQHYLAIYTKVKFLVRQSAFCGTNCVFNCWEEVETVTLPSGEVVNRVSPMLPSKIKQQVCGLCNIVAYVTSGVGKQSKVKQWYYITEGGPTIMAKDQLFMRKSCLPEDAFTEPEVSE